jgi:hypothetical protein
MLGAIMDSQQIEVLLGGEQPSLEDFATFTSIIEKLPLEILWHFSVSFPNMHFILKGVVINKLQAKVMRQDVDEYMNEIVAKFKPLSCKGSFLSFVKIAQVV